jgi:hypothetical protein
MGIQYSMVGLIGLADGDLIFNGWTDWIRQMQI